jgi:hypothetical protein
MRQLPVSIFTLLPRIAFGYVEAQSAVNEMPCALKVWRK